MILQTFLTNAVFPAPTLSSVDVVQHILDSVVAKRLPRVVFEGSVLYVSRIFAHLGPIFLMLPPSPKFLADPPELDLLHGKIERTVPSAFKKIAYLHLFLLGAAELVFAHYNCMSSML